MAEGLKPWDSAEYLHSRDDICLYLEAVAEEDPGDGSLVCIALSNIVRAQSVGNLDGEFGEVCNGLRDALSDAKGPCLTTFIRFTNALGMRLHLSVPPDLEERLASEQKLPANQVGPV